MNKDKSIKDLKQYNDKIKTQLEYSKARVWSLEKQNERLQQELQRKDNITNKAINLIMNIFRDENWYENYDYEDLVSSLKDTLGILRGYKE